MVHNYDASGGLGKIQERFHTISIVGMVILVDISMGPPKSMQLLVSMSPNRLYTLTELIFSDIFQLSA